MNEQCHHELCTCNFSVTLGFYTSRLASKTIPEAHRFRVHTRYGQVTGQRDVYWSLAVGKLIEDQEHDQTHNMLLMYKENSSPAHISILQS
jgi:hypothetical protein